MDRPLQTYDRSFVDSRRLIAGLRHALDMNYARVLDAARREWERNFAGKDPSDACVSVRITSGESKKSALPCGGFLQHPAWSPLNGNGRGSLA
jgi:cell wall assembly regulator SMI1